MTSVWGPTVVISATFCSKQDFTFFHEYSRILFGKKNQTTWFCRQFVETTIFVPDLDIATFTNCCVHVKNALRFLLFHFINVAVFSFKFDDRNFSKQNFVFLKLKCQLLTKVGNCLISNSSQNARSKH